MCCYLMSIKALKPSFRSMHNLNNSRISKYLSKNTTKCSNQRIHTVNCYKFASKTAMIQLIKFSNVYIANLH